MQAKLELYRVFIEVAACGSITLASETLFISQPAVSNSIHQLEEAVGLKLFYRTPKGVSLTIEGKLLYEYALPAIDLLRSAEQKLAAVKNLEDGELRIGASDTLSRHLLLPMLEKFNKAHSGVKLQIVNRTSLETAELVKKGKVDIGFFNLPLVDEKLHIEKFVEVQDVFVASKEYITANKSYTLEEIAALPLILLEKKANSRLFVEDFFKKNGISISPEIELGSHDLLLEFAKIKLGVSCVIREFSKQYLTESGGLFELPSETPLPKRAIGAAWLKGLSLSPSAKAFMGMRG